MRQLDVQLDARIPRLEHAHRTLIGLLIPVVAALVVTAAHSGLQTPDLIQARHFQLVDEEGRVRVDIRHDSSETGVFLLDEDGARRVGAAQFAHGGGGFALHGPHMKGAAVLYFRGQGQLTFYDSSGTVTARFPKP